MAQLKDLIVNGASRLIGDVYTNKIQINSISAYTSSAKTAYGLGSSGQVLKTDGINIYWDNSGSSTENFLPLSGGKMTGPLKWANSTALPEAASTDYFLTTTSFSNDGITQWISKANALKSLMGTSKIGENSLPIYWTGSAFGTISSYEGNAASADKLKTAQKLKVALGSTTDATFDGSAACESIPISGTLSVTNGGTGNNANFTANRLVYSSSETKLLSATSLYASNTGLAVNKTTITSGYNFEVSGSAILSGKIHLSGTAASTALIEFSRGGVSPFNYITIPTDSTLAIAAGDASGDNTRLAINKTAVLPTLSATYTPVTRLGASNLRWQGVYSTFSNQLLTSTSTTNRAGVDNGSGTTPRYIPAKWAFEVGKDPEDGDVYTIKIPVAASGGGAYMSVHGTNNANFYPVARESTSFITSHFGVGMVIQVVFEANSICKIYNLDPTDNTTYNHTGLFRVINFYDSNTNNYAYQRVYKESTNADRPLIASRTATTSVAAGGTAVYGIISASGNEPTVNPSTGAVKIPAGTTTKSLAITPWGGNYGTTTTDNLIWYCGSDATQSGYQKDALYIGSNTSNLKKVVASTFYGALSGTADRATNDANGNSILKTYANTLSLASHTLTLKSKDSTTLSTVTINKEYSVTVDTSWSGSAAPYTKNITVTGITANDSPLVDIDLSSVGIDQLNYHLMAYSSIYRIVTGTNKITLYATEKTDTTITLQLKVYY